MVLKSVAKK